MRGCLKALNVWKRIADFILDKITSDEIEEIQEIRSEKEYKNSLELFE